MIKLARRRLLQTMPVATALPVLARPAMGQTYPARPLRLIVPLPAGGAADIIARHMSRWLERLGQPVVVENKPGAGTSIGVQAVLNSPPDGYTSLLAGTASVISVTLYEKLSFNFLRMSRRLPGLSVFRS